jgi:hypothetical protein
MTGFGFSGFLGAGEVLVGVWVGYVGRLVG